MLACLRRWIRNLLNTIVRQRKGDQPPTLSEGLICSIMHENTAIRLKILSIALMLTLGLTQFAHGQVISAANSTLVQQEDSSAAASDISLSLDANSRFGGLTYVPKEWGEFQLRLENGGNAPQELLVSSYFDGLPTLQFGRKVWLPAQSRIVLSHPVLIPAADQIPEGRALVRSLVIDDSRGQEVLVKGRSGQLQRDRTFLITPTDRHTGIVAGWESTDVVPQEVVDLIVAGRVYQGLNNKLTYLTGQFLPADETSLNYLDHLVLAEDRLVNDLAGLTAIRRWLHSGGRLWIMADRTGPALLEQLFGDEFQGAVVDRVGLTSVRVDDPPSVAAPDGVVGESFEYDEPVEMSRMITPDMAVWNTVNGWPAALTRSYGDGRVLITTLGPRGWITPAPPIPEPAEVAETDEDQEKEQERAERAVNMRSDFVPLSPMEDLAPFIFARRDAEPLPPQTLEPFAREFISYEVPTGTLIIGSMCGFLVLLAATGTGLWRWGRLEHFGWCGSLLAVIFGGMFLSVGLASRHGTSETIASVQLAQAISGTDDVRTSGTIAVYRAEEGKSPIQTAQGGELIPDLKGAEGTNARMVTTDLGTFHWDKNPPQPSGVSVYSVVTSGATADRLEARATLNAQGIVGRCADQLSGGTDAVIATRRGRMSVQLAADGTFAADADDVQEPDQFLDATLVNDVQDRRRRILQQLFGNQQWQNTLDQPHLLLWLSGWEHGFQFGEDLQRQGDTLMIAPLQLSRPAAGTEFVIPSPLLDYVTRSPPDGSSPASFWDDGRQEWQERSSPSTTWLSVQVPRALLPVQGKQAILEINVSGLMGQIEILGIKNGNVVSLRNVTNPVGTVMIEINDPETLTVSENGELPLGVSAGVLAGSDPTQANPAAGAGFDADTPANYWKIESLSVQLRAITTEFAEVD